MSTTVTIREGDQYIGRFDRESAPNAFLLRLVDVALKYGEAEDEDEDGITVTATSDLLTQTDSAL